MACSHGSKFKLEANGNVELTANNATIDVCTATKILDRLHREFTEKYVAPTSGSNAPAGRTAISDPTVKDKPTFYLRIQPTLNGFPKHGGGGTETDGGTINRLYNILNSNLTDESQLYRTAVHAIIYGVYNPSIDKTAYDKPPPLTNPGLDKPSIFKGLYGLIMLNHVLERNISNIESNQDTAAAAAADLQADADNATKYTGRQGIKTTLEEIARRENEIYREKFLHIMLVVVGIFLVSSQLVSKYFSFSGGGGTSGGFGFGSGNLFTGFGLGSGSGLFSRFGGLGLGRSGRSRITSMFSNNPYSLSNR